MTRPFDPPVKCTNCGGMTGLYDRTRICNELGVKPATAEKMMRELPKIVPPEGVLSKVWVRGEDLHGLIQSWEVAA